MTRSALWNLAFVLFELAAGLAVHAAGYSWLQVGLLFAVLIGCTLAAVVAIAVIVTRRAGRRHERELAEWTAQRDAPAHPPTLALTATTEDDSDSNAGAVAA
jgi:hypothetical protein